MRATTGQRRPLASRTQAYVPFTEIDLRRLNAYCEREGHTKGWTIRKAVRDFLDAREPRKT